MLKPRVETKVVDGVLVAEFWDCLRMDPAPVQDLRSRFTAHVRDGGLPVVVADLTGVSFAGSAVLGGFLAMRKQGARVLFCAVEPTVEEVFRAGQLYPLFRFLPDQAAALAAAKAPDSDTPDPPSKADQAGGAPPPLGRLRGRRDGKPPVE